MTKPREDRPLLATKVGIERKGAFEAHCKCLGLTVAERLRALVEADLAAGDLLARPGDPHSAEGGAGGAQPPPAPDALSLGGGPGLASALRAVLREELADLATLLLSARHRVASTAEAVAVVKNAYLSGAIAREVRS